MISNIRRSLLASQKGSGELINGYVGNGLIRYYDGIDNQGIGFPRSSATSYAPSWKDYEGLNPPLTQTYGQFKYTNNSVQWDGWRNTAYWQFNFVEGLTKMTVVCRMQSTNEGTGFSIASSDTSGSLLNLRSSSTQIKMNAGGKQKTFDSTNDFHTLVVSLDFETYDANYYIDGVLVANDTINQNVTTLNGNNRYTTTGTAYYVTPANGIVMTPGYVQTIMVYNRILSASEIYANYQNDLVRFTE